jgi:hypothetical protein
VDWEAWHDEYDTPGTRLANRLVVVREQLTLALDAAPPGPIGLISMCAGQGHDVTGVLPRHPRRADVRALLVELDPRNVAKARQRVAEAGLGNVEIREGDAGRTDNYADLVPAQLVLACGIFGNVLPETAERAIGFFPALCKPGGDVIWTGGRAGLFDLVLACLAKHDFEQRFVSDPRETQFGVGRHTYRGEPQPLERGASMFTFDKHK